ncbi:tail fiber domain-containing protein, partial [Hymenobacter daecheongensis]|uniref:tail fiber domain-containing protein n=1 Tax=Hymenobacter daecheongensis TaxID=496053 RepID=UPI00373FD625
MGRYSFAAGYTSRATGQGSVALGSSNQAAGTNAVALGEFTRATGDNSVALGYGSGATGLGSVALGTACSATGAYATAIGFRSIASGDFSMALGKDARAEHRGAVVISDAFPGFASDYVPSSAPNQLTMRFVGGYIFNTSQNALSSNCGGCGGGAITGVMLAPGGGSWTTLSDRRAKENLRPVDAEQVLAKVAALPVSEWNYKSQPASQRHVGPMAQDFYQAFRLDGIGRDTTINTGDIDGVNMLAIQALAARTARLRQQNEQLHAQLRQHQAQLPALETHTAAAEAQARAA